MKRLMFATASLIAAGCSSTQPQHTQNYPAQNSPSERQADFVGARGPDGPAGSKGAQGPTGQAGAPGYAVAGARGPEGQTGDIGGQGLTGAQGPAGDFAVGPTGVAGPAGDTGPQGTIGQTGPRGASADGYAGPAGPAGRTGAKGATGDTGAKGSTLIGPAGPAGRPGASGGQGERGQTGATGSTTAGVAGASGAAGATGPQGPTGAIGPQGPAGIVERWTSYRDFWFDPEKAIIHNADSNKVAEIAAYMKDNPSLQLGIDGSTNPRATERRDQDLSDRRVKAVRDSLTHAGIPANRISVGMFGDLELRRDGRVEVLIKTDQLSQAQSNPAEPTGVVERWISYRDYWFDPDKSVIHDADSKKAAEIAAFMKQSPSMQVSIDSSMNPNVIDQGDLDLAKRRGNAVRDALIAAGVPASSIKSGAFGDLDLRRDGRVEVLIRSDQLSQAQADLAMPTGEVKRWTSYQDFWFDADTADIHPADASKVTDIAACLKQNPSLQVSIDSSMNPNVIDQGELDLAKRRGNAVHDALIAAGVPASSIKSGAFGDTRMRRDGRVEVLIRTDQLALAK